MVATIVTYELVAMQFNNEPLKQIAENANLNACISRIR